MKTASLIGLRKAAAVIAVLGIVSVVMAAPTRRLPPADISGTIAELNWVPEKKAAGKPGFSGTLGQDRVFPAHFVVTLVNYDGVTSATAKQLSGLLGDRKGRVQGPENLALMLPHEDKESLKTGMRIRVKQYRISGDEGGTWSHCEKIEILKQTPR